MSDEVTQLLLRWRDGDASDLAPLMPIVDGELRRFGRSTMPNGRRDTVLQPTMLVHEAWPRLVRPLSSLENRTQFYAHAARLMRDIRVDQLRRRQALKRVGCEIVASREDGHTCEQPRCLGFEILDEALKSLLEIKSRCVRISELRHLAGLTVAETADVLEISHATVERDWNFARLWLRRELRRGSRNGGSTHRRPT